MIQYQWLQRWEFIQICEVTTQVKFWIMKIYLCIIHWTWRKKNFLLGSTMNFFLAVKHSQTWIIYRYVDLGMLKAYLEAKYTNYFHLHTVQPVLDVSLIDVESSELHSHQTTESWVMNSYTVAMVTTQACCSWHWDLSNWWDFQALQTTKESVWFVIVIHHFSLKMKQSSTS